MYRGLWWRALAWCCVNRPMLWPGSRPSPPPGAPFQVPYSSEHDWTWNWQRGHHAHLLPGERRCSRLCLLVGDRQSFAIPTVPLLLYLTTACKVGRTGIFTSTSTGKARRGYWPSLQLRDQKVGEPHGNQVKQMRSSPLQRHTPVTRTRQVATLGPEHTLLGPGLSDKRPHCLYLFIFKLSDTFQQLNLTCQGPILILETRGLCTASLSPVA